ncbi:hypothetical protein [Schlesneria paludicola]|uniref:hypothetical protein n=1 Tax=Schlesneria paludicola TaxID=360056 RepID=UPI0012FCD103|nr:hypothetical protein [Schlesneria paludicola]
MSLPTVRFTRLLKTPAQVFPHPQVVVGSVDRQRTLNLFQVTADNHFIRLEFDLNG